MMRSEVIARWVTQPNAATAWQAAMVTKAALSGTTQELFIVQ
jgi:hypothetical protein